MEVVAIADAIVAFYEKEKEAGFVSVVKEVKKEFTWDTLINGMKELAEKS